MSESIEFLDIPVKSKDGAIVAKAKIKTDGYTVSGEIAFDNVGSDFINELMVGMRIGLVEGLIIEALTTPCEPSDLRAG